ncbi:hypothetical protein DL89DRAFT_264807 [Linderina pennispora]|uniref:F-box domain-containing protein n=1 Tax=Linderina pennispora TaxID=61395 RepID=A0A1Y1WPG9_9FUNG|nr:uncharacterized protein DL89DRAFT_264807 [Linderina pennispora]ORX75014.1 hypothetical protein DL89DRAFT_264807 [Linderina pennispora]
MTMQQPDRQRESVPFTDITGLCAKSLTRTSTASEYSHVMNFVNSNPHRVNELPETVFGTLLLECYVECDREKCLCNKNHTRDWMWNLGFLIKHNKLHLVTEFRVVVFNECKSPMHIDKVMEDMTGKLLSSLPNVRSILFLGHGVFKAGIAEDVEPRQELKAAETAAKSIRKLFPCVTDLRYHLFKNWGPTPNITKELSRICPLYEYTLKEYAHQLEHLQVLIPFPMNVTKLLDNLTSLSINIIYVRQRRDLPVIPIQCLRILEMFQIEAVIPWHLFEITDGALNFDSLQDLRLEFIQAAAQTVDFPGCSYPVYFPKLSALNITGSAYVYTDIYAYFQGRLFESLTIMDDPTNFENINEHAFESVKILKIGHPTRTPFVDVYSVDMVERLYQLPSSVEEAILGLLDYPLPELIAWVNLRSLKLSASITDKHGLANLLGQLPLLHTLIVDCFSMNQKDADTTRFPDQKITFDEIGEVLDPSSQLPVSESLERLDLFVRGTFDLVGFCELVLRLPRVTKVRTNHHMIPHVMAMLHQVFKVNRNIVFEPFS